ncbi:hypothetical protein B0H66DRAFT_294016 [Apodospora peruviana]|uniref:Protein kinase domain-containing protein n=1 Tax=Apodospora peruviana TaxID=516989 RepID=A0AAE0I0M2_9PEZI|nr:hypothetical protein B0H66DRAFT_294016 [Apodospora peruviana]
MKTEEVSLSKLRERTQKWFLTEGTMPKAERPYTQSSELFDLGAVLYQMMKGRPLPPAEDCDVCVQCYHLSTNEDIEEDDTGCPHYRVYEDVNVDIVLDDLSDYTDGLKKLVYALIRLHRKSDERASALLDRHWPSYVWWTE